MSEKVNLDITRDINGKPNQVTITKRNHKLTAIYRDDRLLDLKGDLSLVDNLKLVYPFQNQPVLNIPQPLSTVSVQGGKTVLFDDLEGLLKWTQITGTVTKDGTVAYNGSNSLKINCAALDASAYAYRSIPQLSGNFTFSLLFSIDNLSNFDFVTFGLRSLGGVRNQTAEIRLQQAYFWQYFDVAGNYPNITAVPGPSARAYNDFHSLDLKVKNWQYQSLKIDNEVFDINQPCGVQLLGGNTYTLVWLGIVHLGAVIVNLYVDDIRVTED